MTTGKIIALTRHIFVEKGMSPLFNMLFRLVITFLSKSKDPLAAVTICSDFGVPKNKVCHCFHCISINLPKSEGLNAMILLF